MNNVEKMAKHTLKMKECVVVLFRFQWHIEKFRKYHLSDQLCRYITKCVCYHTAQKMNFSIKDFFSKCDHICHNELSAVISISIFSKSQAFPTDFVIGIHFSLTVKTLDKKWSFPLRISSVNMTKFVENCGFGHIC